MQQYPDRPEDFDPDVMTICCVPTMCHFGGTILLERLSEAVKVICNNEACTEGEYMHKGCFEQWEETVLTYLRSTGRARSWSEKQRLQNLWTKRGYDLAYKACGCKCGKGHLRKDLDWVPPEPVYVSQTKKKKHRKKKNDKPTLSANNNNNNNAIVSRHSVSSSQQVPVNRVRSASISSVSSTAGSPTDCASLELVYKDGAYALAPRPSHSIFSRRQDFSSFNSLPPNKINSYHIKIDNEADFLDEKDWIFPTLRTHRIVSVNCMICSTRMKIFDRYPLIDGTFFFSPQQYPNSPISMKHPFEDDLYLNAICMSCLEGWNYVLVCNFCHSKWNGSDLILGTVYSYDVIAAIPCCEERLKCTNCRILLPQKKIQFFSDYSCKYLCPNCHTDGYHFVKPISTYTLKCNSR